MIHYKYPEEREYLRFFAERMKKQSIIDVLESGQVPNESQAREISIFFWNMIDSSIEVEKNEELPWPEGADFWNEKISHSFMSYIKKTGHQKIWTEVMDEMN